MVREESLEFQGNFIKRALWVISSIKLSVALILIFIIAQAVATFLPSETEAFSYVYGSFWFEGLMWLFAFNLISVMFRFRTYKKLPFFILHLSILVILLGACITRHFGFKGTLHLRDNQTKSYIVLTNRKNPNEKKVKQLGFSVRLDRFVMRTYPGSTQPSSYDSYITVVDKRSHKVFKYHIYMNHILVYKGFRFYQASYDMDGKGSILSVSYDPGMYITYFGYILFMVSFILAIFYRRSQFIKDVKSVISPSRLAVLFVLFTLSFSFQSGAFSIKEYAVKSKKSASEFSKILVQHNGRVEPFDTLDLDIVHKLTLKSGLLGMNYNQIVAGMISYPEEFEKLPLIYVGNSEIRKVLGLKAKYASYNKFLTKKNLPLFFKAVFEAMHTPDFKRTQAQRDWLKLNERVYVAYLVFNSQIVRIFPLPGSKLDNFRWYSPVEIEQLFEKGAVKKKLARNYLTVYASLIKSLRKYDSSGVRKARLNIYTIQKKYSKPILPSLKKVEWEIKYNHMMIFSHLIGVYTLLGLLSLIIGFLEVIRGGRFKKSVKVLWFLGALALLVHTFNMGLRWYIAGHAPWSDAYESIVFIAWASVFSSLLFFRNSAIGLGSGLFVGGMFMVVASLDNINPQITNIVPVLNSFWLIIHVAFSIVSYGFLSAAAMLGLMNLVLHAIKHSKPELMNRITGFNRIIYIYLVIGLGLLSFGTIFGAVWANQSWGAYWSWDPKETWSLISILVYAFLVHRNIMYRADDRSILFPLLSFLSYFFILMTYFGVNFYIAQGLHSYGRGSGSLSWFYVIVMGMVAWLLVVILSELAPSKNRVNESQKLS